MLKKPCPWCGAPTAVPPATPMREFAKFLEKRCGTCRGGVRALVGWLPFACFLAVWGGFTNLTLYAAQLGLAHWRREIFADAKLYLGLSGLWLASLAAVTAICIWFLVSNSSVCKGSAPKRIGKPE